MLRINEISVPLGTDEKLLKKVAAKEIGVFEGDITFFEIARESIDSRKKNNIKMIYSVNVELNGDENAVADRFASNKVCTCEKYKYKMPQERRKNEKLLFYIRKCYRRTPR